MICCLKYSINSVWKCIDLSSDIDALVGGEVGGLEFGKLPFGACEDPIR